MVIHLMQEGLDCLVKCGRLLHTRKMRCSRHYQVLPARDTDTEAFRTVQKLRVIQGADDDQGWNANVAESLRCRRFEWARLRLRRVFVKLDRVHNAYTLSYTGSNLRW